MFLIYLKVAEEFNYELIIVCYILRMKYILLNSIFILSVISSIDESDQKYDGQNGTETYTCYGASGKIEYVCNTNVYLPTAVSINNSDIHIGYYDTTKITKKNIEHKDDCCSVM